MRRIWAVAVNTIKQAVRMKIAAVFIVLLLVLLPLMAISATGDGTLKGRLQTFTRDSMSLVGLLLCLLTIVLSIYSVTSDIQQRQIYTVVTKPVRRFQILLGKLLGVILLNTVLLAIFSGVIYTIVVLMPRFSRAAEVERAQAFNEFFTARTSITPPQIDVSNEVTEAYKKLEAEGQLEELFEKGESRKRIIARLTRQMRLSKRAVPVGGQLLWEFYNVRIRDPNEKLFVRFKYDVSENPPDLQVYSDWRVGDYRQIRYGQSTTPIHREPRRKDAVRTFQEIVVPADVVADDGYVAVGFLNLRLNDTVVIFPLEDGLEVLYKADNFTANFLRAVLMLLCRLIFLACLGIMAATFLSFPVAILFCIVVFLTSICSTFIIESFDLLGENMGVLYAYTVKLIVRLMPQFDRYDPLEYLVPGRLLSWSALGWCAATMVSLKAFVLLVLALVIFSFREIAKIIV
jgi:hypothetical protein